MEISGYTTKMIEVINEEILKKCIVLGKQNESEGWNIICHNIKIWLGASTTFSSTCPDKRHLVFRMKII